MSDYREMALDFMNKQATIREMTPAEYVAGVKEAEKQFELLDQVEEEFSDQTMLVADPATAIKERTITCCCCGNQYRLLTRKHLASHGLDYEQYRQLCGYKPDLPLIAKSLQRERRNRMREMRLWQKKEGAQGHEQAQVLPKPKALED